MNSTGPALYGMLTWHMDYWLDAFNRLCDSMTTFLEYYEDKGAINTSVTKGPHQQVHVEGHKLCE